MATKKARVLSQFADNGVFVKVGNIAEGDAKVIKMLEDNGFVDSNAAAVKYAEENDGEIVAVKGDGIDPLAAEHLADIEKSKAPPVETLAENPVEATE